MNPRAMTVYARALRPDAREGARALGRRDRDRELPRRGDSFDRALASFAETYADQNERDYQRSAGGRRVRPRRGRVRPLRAASQRDSSLLGDVVGSAR